jgi:type II secretory pathway pseudopilin PulG
MKRLRLLLQWERPRGFALVYAIVVLAIVAIVAVMVMPVLYGTEQTGRANTSLAELHAIEAGTCCGANSFSTIIGFNIGAVSQLVVQVPNAGSLPLNTNSCGTNFGKKTNATWNAAPQAPFIGFWAESTGFEMPVGTLVSAITARSGTKGDNNIYVTINNVDTADANRMDLIGDTATGALTGQITWPTVGNPVSVKYRINLLNGTC